MAAQQAGEASAAVDKALDGDALGDLNLDVMDLNFDATDLNESETGESGSATCDKFCTRIKELKSEIKSLKGEAPKLDAGFEPVKLMTPDEAMD